MRTKLQMIVAALRQRAVAIGTATVLMALTSTSAHAVPIMGIEFPDGPTSFADGVVSYTPGPGVGTSGARVFNDPLAALGLPDYNGQTGAVSLGIGGSIILQFVDNALTTSGDATADLHIFEIGAVVEAFLVEISTNGTDWISLGMVSGQPTSLNIDGVAGVVAGTRYSFVQITDDGNTGDPGFPFAGADIDAVGAISSAPPVQVPEPGTLALLGIGLISLRLARPGKRRRTR